MEEIEGEIPLMEMCGSVSPLGSLVHWSMSLEGETGNRVQTALSMIESPPGDDFTESAQLFPEYRKSIGFGSLGKNSNLL